mmetsp:Transcript_16437/g.43891  ORF Transcript_16437/g.43891 Transcript_16437/m.43891 type:complete len:201 (+) Transcript_16437:2126-2728(+)
MWSRRRARCACSADRSPGFAIRWSPIRSKAACRASSSTWAAVLEKTALKSQPPSARPPTSPTPPRRPESTLRTAPARSADRSIPSSCPGRTSAEPAPCSSTSMQWRPPTCPATHCRSACFAASGSELHSSSTGVAAPSVAVAGAGAWDEPRGRGLAAELADAAGCCSGWPHCCSTSERPFGWMDPRLGAFWPSSPQAGSR